MFPFIAQYLPSFKNRSYQKELIDLGEAYYSEEEYFDCLEKLGAVGRLLQWTPLSRQLSQILRYNSVGYL